MNSLANEQHVVDVLKEYGVRPVEMRQEDDTFIIRTKDQSFTVKKMHLTDDQLTVWESVFHEAYRHQMTTILPVYKTLDDALYVKKANAYYYVTPFIDIERTGALEELFQTIGCIHRKTKRTALTVKEKTIAHFKEYLDTIEEKHAYLQQVIDLFEQQHYMSPVELQVCTHFHIVNRAFLQSSAQITSFLTHFEDDEREHVEWAYSLCHNALSLSDFIRSSESYITNWEQATYANATTDIIKLCQNEFRNNDDQVDAFVAGMTAYESEYILQDTEKHLLSMYLVHPIPYVEAVQSYVAHPRNDSVISHVIALERLFRSLSKGFFLLHEMDRLKRNTSTEKTN